MTTANGDNRTLTITLHGIDSITIPFAAPPYAENCALFDPSDGKIWATLEAAKGRRYGISRVSKRMGLIFSPFYLNSVLPHLTGAILHWEFLTQLALYELERKVE